MGGAVGGAVACGNIGLRDFAGLGHWGGGHFDAAHWRGFSGCAGLAAGLLAVGAVGAVGYDLAGAGALALALGGGVPVHEEAVTNDLDAGVSADVQDVTALVKTKLGVK